MLINNFNKMKYIIAHKKAFLKVEKELLKKNTVNGYLHDLDKLILLIFLPKTLVSKIHKKYSSHHYNSIRKITHERLIQMVIDYECARFTKIDKSMSAREFILSTKDNHDISIFESILCEFEL